MKKFVTLVSFITVLGLMLSACGGAPATSAPVQTEEPVATEPAATEPVATEPAATEPPAEAEGTLKIWADDTRTPILLELADDFRAQYNVELIVEDLGVVQVNTDGISELRFQIRKNIVALNPEDWLAN